MRHRYKKMHKQIAVSAGVLAILAVMMIAVFFGYNRIINARLFAASSSSLEETYGEVAQIVNILTRARWNYLEQVGNYLSVTDLSDTDAVRARIEKLKENYGFTEFYMVNNSGKYITVDGEAGYIDFGDDLFNLVDKNENIVADGSLPGRENMFFYAVSTTPGVYMDTEYTALAFGYDKQALSDILKITAYDGQSDAYLIRSNGRVIVTMGDVKVEVKNFISLLENCGIASAERERIAQDFKNGATDTVLVTIDGVEYYFSYLEAGIDDDWIMASLTPVEAADKDMNEVRLSTIHMLVVIGAFFVIAAILVLGYWTYRAVKDSATLLNERELIFDMMARHMDEIFMLYNENENRMMYISPNVERMLGLSVNDIYTKENVINTCCVNESAWDDRGYLDSIKPGDTVHHEYNMRNAVTGEVHPYSLELYRPEGKDSGVIVMVLADRVREQNVRQEITEAMEAAKAANTAKSSFLSSMSHDIRTPMNAIIGFTTLLEANADDSEKVLGYTRKIQNSSEHLLGLINDVLDMSKIEAGKTTLTQDVVSVKRVVDEMMDLMRPLAEAKNQTLTLEEYLPDDYSVIADKLRLMQVLQNILSNAIKYTQEGGEIHFGVQFISHSSKGDFVQYRFVIKDNGMGMSEEYLKRIFEPFSRETNSTVNKIQGTGLGMAITKNLIDLMGGSIAVDSLPGKGSIFEVMLGFRIEQRSQEDEVVVSSKKTFSLSGMHILAAEDNELNAEILTDLLELEGATVDIAENGEEAVKLFEAAEDGTYRVILMDVQMPVMDGYGATKLIRESTVRDGKAIPIIAMTANAFAEDVQAAMQAGMNAHLAKPVNMDALKTTLEKILSGGVIRQSDIGGV